MAGDLHRHDEYSSFDGFGKATELAALAKELGYTFLGISNHGNTNGLVQHYLACKDVGIKPILGVEGYMLPKYKPQDKGYHLCLFAKNHIGYGNINRIQFEGEKQKYYNPIWDLKILKKYSEGVICTSACVAGFLSQCIAKDKIDLALKFAKQMVEIFGKDFYIEIQPYKISEEGLQEKINVGLIKVAKKLGIKCIFTSDSHRGRKEDFGTYLKMHEIAGHSVEWISSTYKERYMPAKKEMAKRFVKMHSKDFGKEKAISLAKEFERNLEALEASVDDDVFEGLEQTLPKFAEDSDKLLRQKIKEGLQSKGKWTKNLNGLDYISRIQEEYDVIKSLGFQDYFLIVQDYVNWAKSQGIAVGPGRGSCCNCLVAYALGITNIDSLFFDLDFRRFLRKDKKKMPDIDIDFQRNRRGEVIEYLINKYKGHTARIASYGLYKVDNLINDLAKVCGLDTSIKADNKESNKSEIAAIKKHINKFIDDDGNLDKVGLLSDKMTTLYNNEYDNICTHFIKLFKKVRFIGTHAAGVAVTGGNLLDFTSIKVDKDGNMFTNYDLNDMETIHVIKFDMLGLRTMESLGELRKLTNTEGFTESMVKDDKILEAFRNGETDGVFQFDKAQARNILSDIKCDCFDDIIAANAMNRPGPLSLHQPELYAANKTNIEEAQKSPYYEYTKESYGTVIYQEQIQKICVYIGKMTWGDADKVMKMIGGQSQSADAIAEFEKNKKELNEKFLEGAISNGFDQEQAQEMFNTMLVYSFNKGHACGYSTISVEEMFYKVYFPLEYWYSKVKYSLTDEEYRKFCEKAVYEGCAIFLPHINYSKVHTSIRSVDGEKCIQQGLSDIKGVGEKAAQFILDERKKGIFTSFDNFYDRCKSRVVTSRVIDILKEKGALEFKKKIYISRVTKYNSALYSRANSR